MAWFEIKRMDAEGKSRVWQLSGGRVTIGSGEHCTVQIPGLDADEFHLDFNLIERASLQVTGSKPVSVNDAEEVSDGEFEFPFSIGIGDIRLEISVADELETETIQTVGDAEDDATLAPIGSLQDHIATATIRMTTESAALAAASRPVRRVDGYSVGNEIAKGGMGSILKAQDKTLGRDVAMKVIRLDAKSSEEARVRFVREAEVLARLEHPNIVPIHELDADNEGRLFYTMKLVHGQTLQQIINRLKAEDAEAAESYPLDRLLDVFRKVCDAVAFAHSKGVIHRDLKPDNIMVGEFGEVLVMDWGLAKIMGEQEPLPVPHTEDKREADTIREMSDSEMSKLTTGLTLEGTLMGTPQYMSPEQATGRHAETDQRSDVFALGGILHAILTLRPPFSGKKVKDILSKITSGDLPAPTSYNPTRSGSRITEPEDDRPSNIELLHCPNRRVPSALSAVTMRAMKVAAEERYQSAGELERDIAKYQGGFATSAESLSALGQLRLLMHRHKAVTALGALMVILSVGFMVQLFLSREEAQAARQEAEAESIRAKQAEVDARRAEQDALAESKRAQAAEADALEQREHARLSLAQSQIALADTAYQDRDLARMNRFLEACPPDLRDTNWRYLKDKTIADFIPVKTMPLADIAPYAMESGEFLGIGRDGRIFLHGSTGTAKVFARTTVKSSGQLSLCPDGRYFTVSRMGGKGALIYDLRKTDSKLHLVSAPKDTKIHDVQIGPGAKHLLMILQSPPRILMFDVASRKIIWQKREFVHTARFHPGGDTLAVHIYNRQRSVRVLRVTDGEISKELPVTASSPRTMTFSPDGSLLAIGYSSDIVVIDVHKADIQHRFAGGVDRARAVRFIGNDILATLTAKTVGQGSRVATGQHAIQLWSMISGAPVTSILSVPTDVDTFAVNAKSSQLFCGGSTSGIWPVPLGREASNWKSSLPPRHVSFVGTNRLFTGAAARAVADLQVSQSGTELKLKADATANFLVRGPNRSIALLGTPRRPGRPSESVLVKNGVKGLEQRPVPVPLRGTHQTKFSLSADGHRLASGSGSGVWIHAVESGKQLKHHVLPQGSVRALRFISRTTRLALLTAIEGGTGVANDQLVILDTESGEIVRTHSKQGYLTALAVSDNGHWIAIGGQEKLIHILDADTGEQINHFRVHDESVAHCEFHPRLPLLATASPDLSVKLWNYETGEQHGEFLGLARAPLSLVFNEPGDLLACSSDEAVTRVWNVEHLLKQSRVSVTGLDKNDVMNKVAAAQKMFVVDKEKLKLAAWLPSPPAATNNGASGFVDIMQAFKSANSNRSYRRVGQELMGISSSNGHAHLLLNQPEQSDVDWKQVRGIRDSINKTYEAAAAELAKPHLVFAPDWTNLKRASDRHVAHVETYCRMTAATTVLDLMDGKLDPAERKITSMLNLLARTMKEPKRKNLYDYWRQMHTVFRLQWEALQQPGWNETHLKRMQAGWEQIRLADQLAVVTGFKRAEMLQILHDARGNLAEFIAENSGLLNDRGLRPPRTTNAQRNWQELECHLEEALLLEFYDRLFKAIKTGNESRNYQRAITALKELEPLVKRADYWLCRGHFRMRGAYSTLVRDMFLGECARSLAITALAIRRYEVTHGKLPASTAELVPEFIPEVPADYTNGGVIQYATRDKSFKLWAIGIDGEDNGGSTKRIDRGSPNWNRLADVTWPLPSNS